MTSQDRTVWIAPLMSFVLLIFLWSWAVWQFQVPSYLLPSPFAVAQVFQTQGAFLFKAGLLTLSAALFGFLLSLTLGVLTAICFSESRILERALFPYALFLQTVPIVAIAPLIIIWFGTGFQSVVLVSLIISVFPILTNATVGLTRIDPNLKDLFRLNQASRLQTLLRLKLPAAVPSLVTGAQIASGLSVIGAIVGEFFAGYGTDVYGLGYLITLASGQLQTPLLFAAIILSTLLGFLVYSTVSFIGTRILKRWQEL